MIDWDQAEWKIRELVKNLLEPTIMRAKSNHEEIEGNQRSIEAMTEKLTLVEEAIDNATSRLSAIDDFSRQLSRASAAQSMLEINLDKEIQTNRTRSDRLNSQLLSLKESIEVLDQQREKMRSEMSLYSHMIAQNKGHIDDKIAEFSESVAASLKAQDFKFDNFNDTLYEYRHMHQQSVNQIEAVDLLAKKALKRVDLNKKRIVNLEHNLRSQHKEHQKVIDNIKTTVAGVSSQNSRQLNSIVAKIQHELPIKNFLTLAEVIHRLKLDPRTRKRLGEMELERYDKWLNEDLSENIKESIIKAKELASFSIRKSDTMLSHRSVLHKDYTSTTFPNHSQESEPSDKPIPDENIENGPTPLRQVSNKTDRVSFKEEIHVHNFPQNLPNPTVVMSPVMYEAEHLPPDVQTTIQSEVHHTFEDSAESSDSYEPHVDLSDIHNQLKVLKASIDQQKRFTIVEDLRVTEYIESVKQEILEEVTKVYEAATQQTEQLQEQVNKHLNIINLQKHQQEEAQQELLKVGQRFSQEFAGCEFKIEALASELKAECKLRKRAFSDMKTRVETLGGHLTSAVSQYNQLNTNINRLKHTDRQIVEFLKIQVCLDKQDEVDREKVALYGHQETTPQSCRAKPVSLDPSCMSCTSQKSVVINAFKLACLQYVPSPVEYEAKVYTRQALIQTQQKLVIDLHETGLFLGTVRRKSVDKHTFSERFPRLRKKLSLSESMGE